tara:strand:- start:341 stop:583 length:243 start_codon:yes stop_codon:yes gene_type:complete
MMTKKERERVARRFISMHKTSIRKDWLLYADLKTTFYNLIGGVYGSTEDDQIEIDGYSSYTGNPIIFELDDIDDPQYKGE